MDFLKYILSALIGGGVIGVLLAEYLRRRSAQHQKIPLIERVNRPLKVVEKSFTLARVLGSGENRRLEEIQSLREWQFTLRNTSTINLKNAEIQFEFLAEDVEARVERPALSKESLHPTEANVTKPYLRAFRWQIPQLPTGDSVEFTFLAADAPSEKYEAFLSNTDGVILRKSKGEETGFERRVGFIAQYGQVFVYAPLLLFSIYGLINLSSFPKYEYKRFTVTDRGCELSLTSSYEKFEDTWVPWRGPWEIKQEFSNLGKENCIISERNSGIPTITVEPRRTVTRSIESVNRPKLVRDAYSIGAEGASRKTALRAYIKNP